VSVCRDDLGNVARSTREGDGRLNMGWSRFLYFGEGNCGAEFFNICGKVAILFGRRCRLNRLRCSRLWRGGGW